MTMSAPPWAHRRTCCFCAVGPGQQQNAELPTREGQRPCKGVTSSPPRRGKRAGVVRLGWCHEGGSGPERTAASIEAKRQPSSQATSPRAATSVGAAKVGIDFLDAALLGRVSPNVGTASRRSRLSERRGRRCPPQLRAAHEDRGWTATNSRAQGGGGRPSGGFALRGVVGADGISDGRSFAASSRDRG
jgi:hypothetical protein